MVARSTHAKPGQGDPPGKFPSKHMGFRVITKIIVKINKVKFPRNDVNSNDDEFIKEAW